MPKLGAEPIRRAALVKATIETVGEAGSLEVTVARITSYNVCYTKLLRLASAWLLDLLRKSSCLLELQVSLLTRQSTKNA